MARFRRCRHKTARNSRCANKFFFSFVCFLNSNGLTKDVLYGNIIGSKVGVYVGQMTEDYAESTVADPYANVGYAATGGGRCMSSNRLSHFYDWKVLYTRFKLLSSFIIIIFCTWGKKICSSKEKIFKSLNFVFEGSKHDYRHGMFFIIDCSAFGSASTSQWRLRYTKTIKFFLILSHLRNGSMWWMQFNI
jgi:hypothetical protein